MYFNLANSWKISEVNSAKLQKYLKFVDENHREPVDEKFADDTERILKLIGILIKTYYRILKLI